MDGLAAKNAKKREEERKAKEQKGRLWNDSFLLFCFSFFFALLRVLCGSNKTLLFGHQALQFGHRHALDISAQILELLGNHHHFIFARIP
jgi:hypothetical protein